MRYLPFDFSIALTMIKLGKRIRRQAWPQGTFLFLVHGSTFAVNREPLMSILGAGAQVTYRPHIDLRLEDGSIGAWSMNIDDVMADDWELA